MVETDDDDGDDVLNDDEEEDDDVDTLVPPLPVAAEVYVHFELSRRHFSKFRA